ncbi:hypothetical protein GOB93_06025 [Acetobacter musti]|uniref:Uncharacterized protein n=1 Tax=Acetobacter musti TaxID=864732 RepID=A0ABX0JNX4_9PROT|nr:hypothetical protein [Acetobacter musti]NHN84201.1 hypothetical protein [Acetobacter musti]
MFLRHLIRYMRWLTAGIVTCMFSPYAAHGAPVRQRNFVGCPADGQTGPIAPPDHLSTNFSTPRTLPAGLTIYAAEDIAAVAPAGWHCLEMYGSSGSFLLLQPQPIPSSAIISDFRLTGPAIQVSSINGETSGRFAVAGIIARLFPAHQAFVDKVIHEGIEPATDFPRGPYPADQMTRVSPQEWRYTTPAHATGLGTQSRLAPNSDPVSGIVKLDSDMGVFEIQVRLGPADSKQTPDVISLIYELNRRAAE